MTAADRFMKKISDFYDDLGYPVVWEDVGSERQLEIQFKSESGYFVTATLLADGNDIIRPSCVACTYKQNHHHILSLTSSIKQLNRMEIYVVSHLCVL